MTKKIINIGVEGNDATGDAIRDAFRKVNENFNELYTAQGSGDGIPFTSLSDYDKTRNGRLIPNTVFIVDDTGSTILAKKLISSDNSVTINYRTGYDAITAESAIDITSSGGKLSADLNPKLGGDLDGRNQFFIYNVSDPDNANATAKALALNTTVEKFAINKGYADNHYVRLTGGPTGGAMSGYLTVPAGATGSAVAQRQELVGKSGDTMTGALLLNADPSSSSDPLTAATKNYVDISSYASNIDYYVSNGGRTYAQMTTAGVQASKRGRALAYAFSTISEACYYAEVDIYNSSLEPGPYKQPITINNGAGISTINAIQTGQTQGGVSNLTVLTIVNSSTFPNNVDQGVLTNIDLTPGKLIVGGTSGAVGTIHSYSNGVSYDTLYVKPISGSVAFQTNEPLYYDNATPRIQITINVESGIYEEHLPIRVPRNVSIVGSEMRRTIVRPKDAVSLSPWVDVYFYRDKTIDSLTINTTANGFGYHYLTDPTLNTSTAKNNKDLDVFMMNDATGLKDITIQGHGGFAVVLDPEGQVLTKSPYIQNCSSIAASKNTKAFRGGAFIDGNVGRMSLTIDTAYYNDSPVSLAYGTPVSKIDVSGLLPFIKARSLDSEIHRIPNVPTAFWVNGQRIRVEKIIAHNDTLGTATLTLGDTYYAGQANIVLETAGNRSMLATHFTQVNDLGYGIFATNNALIEIVSVFTYYNHTAVYALNGAQVRSVSGSNSNGYIGLKAEGSDPNEVPRQVILADNLTQVARVYKKGYTYNGAGYNAAGGGTMIVYGFDYIPYSSTEIQINHPIRGRVLYSASTVTPVVNSVAVTNLFKFGNNGAITLQNDPGFVAGDSVTISGVTTTGYTEFNGTFYVTSTTPPINLTGTFPVSGGGGAVTTYPTNGTITLVTADITSATGGATIVAGMSVTCSQAGVFSGTSTVKVLSVTVSAPNTIITFDTQILQQVVSGTTFTFSAIGAITMNIPLSPGLSTLLAVSKVTATLTGVSGSSIGTIPSATTFNIITPSSGAAATAAATYTAVASTGGSGTGATFTVTKTSGTTYYGTTTITLVNGGQNYAIGDIITISGTLLGGGGNLVFALATNYRGKLVKLSLGNGISGAQTTFYENLTHNDYVVLRTTQNFKFYGNFTDITSRPSTAIDLLDDGSIGAYRTTALTNSYYSNSRYPNNGWGDTEPLNESPFTLCVFNGTINGNILTVNTITSGSIITGLAITGTGIIGNVIVGTQIGVSNQWNITNPNSISLTGSMIAIQQNNTSIITTDSTFAYISCTLTSYSTGAVGGDTSIRVIDLATADQTRILGMEFGWSDQNVTQKGFKRTVTGYTPASIAISSVTRTTSAGQNTTIVTSTPHLYKSGDTISISGLTGTNASLNSFSNIPLYTITKVNDTTYTFNTPSYAIASISSPTGSSGAYYFKVNLPALGTGIYQSVGSYTISGHGNTNYNGTFACTTSDSNSVTLLSTSPTALGAPSGTGTIILSAITTNSVSAGSSVASWASVTLDSALPTNTLIPNGVSIQSGLKSYGYSTIASGSGNNIASSGAVTSIPLTSASTFFNNVSNTFTDNRYVKIDNEYFLFTGVNYNTNTLTGVVRAQLGSVAAAHTNGTTVYEVSGLITANISTCRATSHDFLNIGTGGYNQSNFPNNIFGPSVMPKLDSKATVDSIGTSSVAEVQEKSRGRVFSASTNQDGFFRIGKYFTVDQGTGSVSLNAATVLTGLSGLGFTRGTYVSEFSTDTAMPLISDAVPTNTAVRTYIDRRLGMDASGTIVTNGIGPGYIPRDGSMGAIGNISLGNFKITNLLDPTSDKDAVTKAYADLFLKRVGGTSRIGVESFVMGSTTQLIISTINKAANVATVVTSTPHSLSTGQTVTVTGVNNAGFIGFNATEPFTTTVTQVVDAYTFKYAASAGTAGGSVTSCTVTVPSNLNINSNRIVNVGTPVDATDATTKGYVDSKASIVNLSDVTLTSATTSDLFAYNGTKWVNGASTGDVTASLSGNTLTFSIGNGKVTNAMISSSAAIDQNKLLIDYAKAAYGEFTTITGVIPSSPSAGSVTLTFSSTGTAQVLPFPVGTRIEVSSVSVSGYNGTYIVTACNNTSVTYTNSTTTAATGGIIRSARGLSSFNNSQFTVSNGYVSVAAGGLDLTSVGTNILSGVVLGNVSGGSARPTTVSTAAVLANAIGTGTGLVASTAGTSYSTVAYGTAATANTIVQRDANGNILTSTMATLAGVVDTSGTGSALRIVNPGGASYATATATQTGAIKIKLPTGGLNSSTMMRFTIKIYEFAGAYSINPGLVGNSRTIEVGGYNYSDAKWYNTFATQTTQNGADLNVRFGYDSTSNCVWLGELTTVWNYPQIFVTEFQAGYNNYTSATWGSGWAVSFATTFDTVSIQGGASLTSPILAGKNWISSANNLPAANNVYTLGSSSAVFANVYSTLFTGTATQARYADLAEKYTADQNYETGTVVMLGGEEEVTLARGQGTSRVAGVISDKPSYLMNSELDSEFVAIVALQGRVPCKVIGKVSKGDMLIVSMVPGVAMASDDPRVGSVIGKALANYDGDRIGIIEVLVGKH